MSHVVETHNDGLEIIGLEQQRKIDPERTLQITTQLFEPRLIGVEYGDPHLLKFVDVLELARPVTRQEDDVEMLGKDLECVEPSLLSGRPVIHREKRKYDEDFVLAAGGPHLEDILPVLRIRLSQPCTLPSAGRHYGDTRFPLPVLRPP